jgi:formate hydrogenlyase subunit 4
MLVPVTGSLPTQIVSDLAAMALLAVLTGVVESGMARLRLIRVPQLLVGSLVLTTLALILGVR